jgi:tetratricopeptide (TPR) repeat protein
MRRFILLKTLLSSVIYLTAASGQEEQAPQSRASQNLTEARQFGWKAVAPVMENLGKSDPGKFPGLIAFSKAYEDARQQLDPDKPPATWPAIDIEKLVTKNPNFWRANYEIGPGDPLWLYCHAGLLLGAGEATRAQGILALARQTRGTPQVVRDAIDKMLRVAERVIKDGNDAVAEGITLFDKGDKAGAVERYRAALKIWPQNSFAHYELGLTLRDQALEAKGEKLPKAGTIEVKSNMAKMPEVESCFAQSRLHDPLRWEAYQGNIANVMQRLIAIRKARDAWMTIASSDDKFAPDDVLKQFADSCRDARAYELALVARQLVINRQRQFGREDHDFISDVLRKQAPGPASEAALKFLDNPRIELRSLTVLENAETGRQ